MVRKKEDSTLKVLNGKSGLDETSKPVLQAVIKMLENGDVKHFIFTGIGTDREPYLGFVLPEKLKDCTSMLGALALAKEVLMTHIYDSGLIDDE